MNENRALRYVLDRTLRAVVMWIMNRVTAPARQRKVYFRREQIRRILLVRSLFRLGDSILATPAIALMRDHFPKASIDFVGPKVTKSLSQGLSIDRYYEIHRSFPRVCWSYLELLIHLRRNRYDLAIDVSGWSAALGSFIVGFSGARFRVGLQGKWDRWFNFRVARPAAVNKYAALPELVTSLGLRRRKRFSAVALSPAERVEGSKRVAGMLRDDPGPIVGIFAGGRKSRGKRWPSANFVELAMRLRAHDARPIVFIGPEEMDLLSDLRFALADRVPLVFEPDIRKFASAVASCDLFVACDSGPVHLACALRARTVAVFLKNNFDRWGPPPELASIVYRDTGVEVADVLEACRAQLNGLWPQPLVEKIANRSCQGIGPMKTCRRAWLRHRLPRRRLEQIAD